MVRKFTWSLHSIRSQTRPLPSLWPKQPGILIICLVVVILTIFIRFEPVGFDYSDVSGFFGPGAFWAWVITCLNGFCPNEGRHLLRVIWKEPWTFPMPLFWFSELPPLQIEDQSIKGELPCGNNLGEDDKLQNDKIKCISRLLKEIMQDTLTDAKESSTHLSILRFWLLQVRSSDRQFFRRTENDSDNAFLQADCADLVLDSFPVFFREEAIDPRFIRYSMFADEPDIPRQDFSEVTESLVKTCCWFTMNEADFAHYLIEFRNRIKFWTHQMETAKAEIPREMDLNTWAAVLYALISCWVCFVQHGGFESESWRPEDDAAACIAQFAFCVSALALLSSHPRTPERDPKSRGSLRLSVWFVVYWHSWLVIHIRGYYIENERSIPNVLALGYNAGLTGLLALRMCFLVLCRHSWIARKFRWFTARQALPDSGARVLTAWFSLVPWSYILNFWNIGRYQRVPKIPWGIHVGLPIPTSSASISDLDQAAALATVVALLLAAPFQFVMISFGRCGLGIIDCYGESSLEKLIWLIAAIKAILSCLVLSSRALRHPTQVGALTAAFIQDLWELVSPRVHHQRYPYDTRHDSHIVELRQRTTGQMEEGIY